MSDPLPTACAFHSYDGTKGPCPWCAEAAGVDKTSTEDYNKVFANTLHCPACSSLDIRSNELGAYLWCGACGHHLPPKDLP